MYKLEDFEKLLDTNFVIPFENDLKIEITLSNIIKGNFIESLNIQPFTLEFKALPDTTLLNQDNYKIISHDNQEFVMMLIPRSSNEKGHSYDSVFN